MTKKYLKAPPLNAVKKSKDYKICITLSDDEILDVENDTKMAMYSLFEKGYFIISNYPLTIECNTCKGKGEIGIIKIDVCGECKGSGQVNLYRKRDKDINSTNIN